MVVCERQVSGGYCCCFFWGGGISKPSFDEKMGFFQNFGSHIRCRNLNAETPTEARELIQPLDPSCESILTVGNATHLQPMAKTRMATCSHWSFWIGSFWILFFPSTFSRKHFNTTWISSEIYRMTQKLPKKSALRHFFTSSSNFWCIGVSGSSSAKRRTESSLAEKIVQQESLTCSCLMGKLYYFMINNTYPWQLLDPSFPILIYTNQRNPCSLISCCNVWIPCSNGNWDVERLTMPTNHFNPSFDSIGPR